ncbi:MAG: M28 family peptidase [Saprospiraceae bacterium]|nr:M28 family peptidase [Saprospiraceae bacterium]
MKKGMLLVLVLSFTQTVFWGQKFDVQQLKVDVVYLASDYLEGRETGKKGEQLAAEYIAYRFEQLGLAPKGDDGSYFHEFDFKYSNNPHVTDGGDKKVGKNVVAYLDNGAANTIVIGAHYDHLGMGGFGSLYTGEPAIHNGADDNASGIAAMLKIAAHLKQGRAKSNNYLFIGFSGEEMGLFGSKKYVENPTIDLSKVNYMINMDMVGRLNEEKVLAIHGVGTSPVFAGMIDEVQVGGIKAKTSDSGIGPSDHTSFYLKDIPVLHFFTGQHSDYHKPVDDAALVNYKGLNLVGNYIIAIIEKLDGSGKVAFTKTKNETQGRQAASFKVTLGVMPDYVSEGDGMKIDSVIEGRPGAEAGMQSGDVIVKMGDMEVKDIYDYMKGLGKYKKGETTTIVVLRGKEKKSLKVTF